MFGIKLQDCISNNAIFSITNTKHLVYYVRKCGLAFLGHILHFSEEKPARRYAANVPSHGKKKSGCPRTSYITYIQLLEYHELEADEIATLAKD